MSRKIIGLEYVILYGKIEHLDLARRHKMGSSWIRDRHSQQRLKNVPLTAIIPIIANGLSVHAFMLGKQSKT